MVLFNSYVKLPEGRSGIILTKTYQYIGDDHYQLGESDGIRINQAV